MRNQFSSSVTVKSSDPIAITKAVTSYAHEIRLKHPEIVKIIWFGSWITGIPTYRSDVDICLVLSSSDKTVRDRISDYLPSKFPVGIDLFPYTESELNHLKDDKPSWYSVILSGKEI